MSDSGIVPTQTNQTSNSTKPNETEDEELFAGFGKDRSTHQPVPEIMVEKDVAPANPSFTVDPKYPGAGIKRPSQGGKPTGGNIKSKYGKKSPKPNKGTHADGNYGSAGAVASGGSGGSMGTKADSVDIWEDSPFSK